MIAWRLLIVLIFCIVPEIYSQDFTNQQKAWLYKVVKKSPCLNNNLGQYFQYKGKFQPKFDWSYLSKKEQIKYEVSLWDSIEHSIVFQPECLVVDWVGVRSASPGVLAEAAVKLTLWEIYSNIKSGYQENPMFSNDSMAKYIHDEAIKFLPSIMRSGNELKSKYQSDFYTLINPSLNFKRKSDVFAKIKKVSPSLQRQFFERWFDLINKIVKENSETYFKLLSDREIFFTGKLLAVGEGSGSTGLLGEFEDVNDKHIDTGTGKGIGLFTYKLGIKRGELELESTTETKIKLLSDEPTLLHLSLWGMDWAKKPLIVIERGDKSYLLYGGQEFSPDSKWTEGTSYFDVLEEFKARKIDRIIKDLNKEGGLLPVYQRESNIKDKIENQIDLINDEIDSIKALENPNQIAIQQRISKNDVNLKNLSAKEERLRNLQNKISLEYQKLDKAEKELVKMNSVLGNNIQGWQLKDSVFMFSDGTVFNSKTQDFILYNDSSEEESINVRLLAASYSIYSDKKDEVQLYINVTGGVDEVKGKDTVISQQDTLLTKSFYFEPDGYEVRSLFKESDVELLNDLAKQYEKSDFRFETSFIAMGVDTVIHNNIAKDRLNYAAKKDHSRYVNARRVDLLIIKCDNKFSISIKGYTDAGSTKLSQAAANIKNDLNRYNNKEQTLNPALSVLRVKSVIDELEKVTGMDFSQSAIEVPVLNLKIETNKVK